MCGIAGWWRPGASSTPVIAPMLSCIAHRGPDDEGTWTHDGARIALGQRRLAILDLSPGGHQPMSSRSGRFVITFNGEIYNFLELKAELAAQGAAFHTTSDTEVMLAAIETWGLEAALGRFAGMFAFTLWDRERETLTLARDRFGKKPLYYAFDDVGVAFASEVRPFEAVGLTHRIDRGALTLLVRNAYVPQPYSIWSEVRKLAPGHTIEFDGATMAKAAPRAYWSAREVVQRGARSPWQGSEEAALAALDSSLRLAVKERMIADVPLGAFLSGGVDSSLVVALMQEQSDRPVKTFTIGFDDADYDEAKHAKRVAEYLGTEHTELYVTPEDAMKVIPRLARIFDEPFADSSQIPTFLVSQLARRHVAVALSGDGGDEVFGGYNRYLLAQRVWRRIGAAPRWSRSAAAAAIRAVPPKAWDAAYRGVSPLLGKRHLMRLPGVKAHKFARVLGARDEMAFYEQLVTTWSEPERLVKGGFQPDTLLSSASRDPPADVGFIERMMLLDTLTYLPEDILVKVDRASMAVSLETRAPLLDHRVFELAWRLPLAMRVRGSQTKWALRQLLYKRVPREMLERPKMGFGVPVDAWLRGPMRSWAETLLDPQRLAREGYFDVALVSKMWSAHLAGRRNAAAELWPILMFQLWLEAHPEAA